MTSKRENSKVVLRPARFFNIKAPSLFWVDNFGHGLGVLIVSASAFFILIKLSNS